MSRSLLSVRFAAAAVLLGTAGLLGGCSSSASHFESDYVSPIAATPAPQPVVPVSVGAPSGQHRMPLLPPVPDEEVSNGLPPVTMAAVLPSDVR